jgi:HPt (histidine-containing phosphotransfer) domain-containing protein
MSSVPPPNADLADLARVIGEENVRTLIRTFLREYPTLLRSLREGDRKTRHRMAHSLKSNARIIGARELSAEMAAYELRLSEADAPDLTPTEIDAIAAKFDATSGALRVFAGEA